MPAWQPRTFTPGCAKWTSNTARLNWRLRNPMPGFGFKSEGLATTTFFQASDHSRLELLGGLYCTYPGAGLVPLAVSRDSEVCLSLSSFGGTKAGAYPVVLRDERNGQVTEVPDTRFKPRRTICPGERIIPLLTNTPK